MMLISLISTGEESKPVQAAHVFCLGHP